MISVIEFPSQVTSRHFHTRRHRSRIHLGDYTARYSVGEDVMAILCPDMLEYLQNFATYKRVDIKRIIILLDTIKNFLARFDTHGSTTYILISIFSVDLKFSIEIKLSHILLLAFTKIMTHRKISLTMFFFTSID